MPMQQDINTAGEGLREHRVANRPWWVVVGSKFVEGDLGKLSMKRAAHAALNLIGLNPGEKITDFVQPGPNQRIDPAMYETGGSREQLMLATGMQPANLGSQSNDETATGQAIAEGSRISVDESNKDDVDFFLGVLAQMSWEMLIQEMDSATVKELIGRGAVWPDITKEQIADEIFLQIEAGSSGKPNQALETAKAEKLGPLIIQAVQLNDPRLWWLVKVYARILDSKVDIDEIMRQGGGPQMPQMGQALPQQSPTGIGGPLPPGVAAPNVKLPTGQPVAPPLPPAQRNLAAVSAGRAAAAGRPG